MLNEKVSIKSEAIFSEDRKHRYLLFQEWDKSKPKAAILMITAGLANGIYCDLTTMLCKNNAAELGYGAMYIVNLFSRTDVMTKGRKDVKAFYDENTDQYIRLAGEKADTIILAWGASGTETVKQRQQEVMELLAPYREKFRMIVDEQNREYVHPLCPSVRNGWSLKEVRKQ